jgi:hypothetical protein
VWIDGNDEASWSAAKKKEDMLVRLLSRDSRSCDVDFKLCDSFTCACWRGDKISPIPPRHFHFLMMHHSPIIEELHDYCALRETQIASCVVLDWCTSMTVCALPWVWCPYFEDEWGEVSLLTSVMKRMMPSLKFDSRKEL